MNTKEKILLIQLLLYDIRCNWGWERFNNPTCARAIKARELCDELAVELNDDRYSTLGACCSEYIRYYYDDRDGRYFRDEFPHGYENMDVLHGLEVTYLDKSEEFKKIVSQYITYPETKFDDWDAVMTEETE